MSESGTHVPVLMQEAVAALMTDKNGFYVDGTFGRGGHSGQILGELSGGGRLLAIDKDEQAVATGSFKFGDDPRFAIEHGSFANLSGWLNQRKKMGQVAGILLDLGMSSPQLDQAERGFSFLQDGPLDMRMDQSSGQTAAEWINSVPEEDIAKVLKDFGEERFSRRMARAVVTARTQQPIVTTGRLAKIITGANPAWEKDKHPATRAFQGIRIFINRELQDLDELLPLAIDALKVGGRLVVISFHSLEDRRVKRFIQRCEQGDEFPSGVPVTKDKLNRRLKRLGKAVKPEVDELQRNPRARSAIMRVAEKIL